MAKIRRALYRLFYKPHPNIPTSRLTDIDGYGSGIEIQNELMARKWGDQLTDADLYELINTSRASP